MSVIFFPSYYCRQETDIANLSCLNNCSVPSQLFNILLYL
ncbi:hypothetical protein HMPREF1548_01734 [Clostridium sp. KLE 1755]|nr:hypothetical protein HMPREF1548_01734 [Clostridium sp. KLE 1755]